MSREHWIRTNQLNSSAILPQKSKKSKNYFKESLLPKQLYAQNALYFADFTQKQVAGHSRAPHCFIFAALILQNLINQFIISCSTQE